MARDFPVDVLPTGTSNFYNTMSGNLHQMDRWGPLASKMQILIKDCAEGPALSGWTLKTKNIVVAFWPTKSVMNEQYGYYALTALSMMNSPVSSASAFFDE